MPTANHNNVLSTFTYSRSKQQYTSYTDVSEWKKEYTQERRNRKRKEGAKKFGWLINLFQVGLHLYISCFRLLKFDSIFERRLRGDWLTHTTPTLSAVNGEQVIMFKTRHESCGIFERTQHKLLVSHELTGILSWSRNERINKRG
jgi:hypothetical protein